ncbi:peroxiredoxin [Thiomicrorhabdus sediminis]|uniref:thioredoxin-dependent peroxiredoxin n=1 Tax=Thiomicrorhabdus sediminis TaxID=2580412 RepID=A0A4P9K5P0_9GAMM|nr:peroxiredoxin [Thiomicrorhabdus sediminis]QCU90334.1 peroxiredoxin [Thiomicrorhabdus sediminis]
MLKIGDQAPDFSSPNQDNQIINLAGYQGKRNVVLYFYPKDDTPGCTIEANEFSALIEQFSAADATIIGVSKDDCGSHQAFIKKYNLRLDLLADTSGELCEAYGVWQDKQKHGETVKGIVRSTFVIDKQGQIAYAEYKVNPEGHAQKVLEKTRKLN